MQEEAARTQQIPQPVLFVNGTECWPCLSILYHGAQTSPGRVYAAGPCSAAFQMHSPSCRGKTGFSPRLADACISHCAFFKGWPSFGHPGPSAGHDLLLCAVSPSGSCRLGWGSFLSCVMPYHIKKEAHMAGQGQVSL